MRAGIGAFPLLLPLLLLLLLLQPATPLDPKIVYDPTPLFTGAGHKPTVRDNTQLAIETHHEHDVLDPNRVLGPLSLPCCTCGIAPVAAAGAVASVMTNCEICGHWTGPAEHIDEKTHKIKDSASKLEIVSPTDAGGGGWVWIDGASFVAKDAPCLSSWNAVTALSCLQEGPMAGKRIMFEGDSFVRNAFMGVLQLLRGREGDGSFTYPKSGWLAKGCGGLHLK